MSKQTRHANRGVTLIEVVVSTVLVGVVLVAALNTLGGAARSHLAAARSAAAGALAESVMAEALALPYEDPDGAAEFGIESGEGNPSQRDALDDADDLSGWVESPPTARDGSALAGYTGWTLTVTVELVEAEADSGVVDTTGSDEGLKRVRVAVADPDGVTHTLDAFRSASGGAESPLDLTLVGRLSVEAAVGGAREQLTGDQLLNELPTP